MADYYVINMLPIRAQKQIKGLSIFEDLNLSESDIIYQPPNIIFESRSAGSKKIIFNWRRESQPYRYALGYKSTQ
jgi:hypothetical protein